MTEIDPRLAPMVTAACPDCGAGIGELCDQNPVIPPDYPVRPLEGEGVIVCTARIPLTWQDEAIDALYRELDRIPAPPGAINVNDWDYDETKDAYSRGFDVREWKIPNAGRCDDEVSVTARQIATVTWPENDRWHIENCRIGDWALWISTSDELTADHARQLAAALLEAADELDARRDAP